MCFKASQSDDRVGKKICKWVNNETEKYWRNSAECKIYLL